MARRLNSSTATRRRLLRKYACRRQSCPRSGIFAYDGQMIANRAKVPDSSRSGSSGRGYGIAADGPALRRARQIRGATGAELARRAGVSPATVSQAENGHRVHPRMLKAIAEALVSMEPVPGLADI